MCWGRADGGGRAASVEGGLGTARGRWLRAVGASGVGRVGGDVGGGLDRRVS